MSKPGTRTTSFVTMSLVKGGDVHVRPFICRWSAVENVSTWARRNWTHDCMFPRMCGSRGTNIPLPP